MTIETTSTVEARASGGARPGFDRSNDLAERLPTWLPPWLSFFSFKRNIKLGLIVGVIVVLVQCRDVKAKI